MLRFPTHPPGDAAWVGHPVSLRLRRIRVAHDRGPLSEAKLGTHGVPIHPPKILDDEAGAEALLGRDAPRHLRGVVGQSKLPVGPEQNDAPVSA